VYCAEASAGFAAMTFFQVAASRYSSAGVSFWCFCDFDWGKLPRGPLAHPVENIEKIMQRMATLFMDPKLCSCLSECVDAIAYLSEIIFLFDQFYAYSAALYIPYNVSPLIKQAGIPGALQPYLLAE
jgi:hypothetical protein